MNLAEELIKVLQKAKDENIYFNPYIVNGVLEAINDGCPEANNIISEDTTKWAYDMWSW
jgi:hypothetical protein